MAMARLITNFMSTGTHAARPATPTLGTGEIALYYETDTLHMFAYVSGAWTQIDSVSAGAALVQNKSVILASHATGITLAVAPTQHNLLIALVADESTSPTAAAGWTLITSASAAHDGYGILWKLAGAGESTTQTPCSDTHAGTITMFEISNAAPGACTAVTEFSGTSIPETPTNTKATGGGGIIVGVYVNRTTNAPTSITGTGVSADNTASGSSRYAAAFHISPAVNGTNTVTAAYAGSEGGVFIACAVG